MGQAPCLITQALQGEGIGSWEDYAVLLRDWMSLLGSEEEEELELGCPHPTTSPLSPCHKQWLLIPSQHGCGSCHGKCGPARVPRGAQ